MPKKGEKQRYRVHFRYEHGMAYPEDHNPLSGEPIEMQPIGPPVEATNSYSDGDTADRHAREISRRGGRAEVIHVDPVSSERSIIRTYEPGEVSDEDSEDDSDGGDQS